MTRRRALYYMELHYRSGCTLTTKTYAQARRRFGHDNLKTYRLATQKDVDWVVAMGGDVPEDSFVRKAPK